MTTKTKAKPGKNIPALKELKRIALSIPPDKLDLRTYGTTKHDPTTPADLATWAARDAWFIKRGFMMADFPLGKDVRTYPTCLEHTADHATQAFFALNKAENAYLFGSYEDDPHPLSAVLIARIDAVINDEFVETEAEGGNAA